MPRTSSSHCEEGLGEKARCSGICNSGDSKVVKHCLIFKRESIFAKNDSGNKGTEKRSRNKEGWGKDG